MKRKQLIKLFRDIIISFLLFQTGFTQTLIEVDIEENTIWDINGSPYYIMPDNGEVSNWNYITVMPGVTLTIEAGVEVIFDLSSTDEKTGLMIEGVEGNAAILFAGEEGGEEVLFTSYKLNPEPGDWGCIKFKETSEGTFYNCTIEYAGGDYYFAGGIVLEVSNDEPAVKVHNSTIRYCYGWGICGSNAPALLIVEDCYVYSCEAENGGGIRLTNFHTSSYVRRCIIEDCKIGLILHGYGGGLYNNLVLNSTDFGIRIEGGSPDYSRI